MPRRLPIEPRFWASVNKNGPIPPHCPNLGPCWVWTKTKRPSGYGVMSAAEIMPRVPVDAHRISWMIHHGQFPFKDWVLHKCDNPACVNPSHLFLGTREDNIRDAVEKGRTRNKPRYGEDSHYSKLTWDKVRAIRTEYLSGASAKSLGDKFGVTKENIYMIVKNKTWKESLHTADLESS